VLNRHAVDFESSLLRFLFSLFCPFITGPRSQWKVIDDLLRIMAPPTPSSYRPRKKRRSTTLFAGSNNPLTVEAEEGKLAPAFPLVSFLWGARAGVSQWLVLPLVLMTVGLFRWAVSLWGYSGKVVTHAGSCLIIL
jgi:hypothetical protein